MWASYLRRLIIFANEYRQWFLIIAPFVNVMTTVLIIAGFVEVNVNGKTDETKKIISAIVAIIFPFLLLYGFAACSAIYTLMPVGERETKMRSLLHMIGIKPVCYYLGMFWADFTLFMIPTILFVGFVGISNLVGFADQIPAFTLMLASFGSVLINFTYCFSHLFKDTKSSFKCLTFIYICLGDFIPGIGISLSAIT
mmetsp:Transcript_69592/g.96656  ORF Transcript_69592/g.96656 Transcript_69592/m.96656 type:complete len:197 (+) Transcript_69592:2085-2675(+)